VILLKFLPYVWKTVRRAPMRSLLTIVGTALALGLFAFVRTLEGGVDRFQESAAKPIVVVFQQSRFCPLTSELPERYRAQIESVPGVEETLPTTIYVNMCRSNLDLVTLHGVDGATLDKVHGLRFHSGDIASWRAASNGALVGRRLAERRGLVVGQRVRLGVLDVEVKGIVDGDGPGLDNVAFVHEKPLQLVRDLQGQTSEYFVRLAPGADAEAVAREIDRLFATDVAPTDTKTLQAFVQGAVEEVAEIVGFARLLGYLAVLVVVLIVGNTVFISAQTRAQELGALETLGVTKARLASLLLLEGLLLAVMGGAIGTTAVLLWFHFQPTTLGVEGFGIDFVAGPEIAVAGLVASLVVGVLAALGPAIEAVLRPVADAVRPA
jgi:putative ABC transport system permease protein